MLFFDEINTNENIAGLLKEILVDHRMEGSVLSKYLVPVAACNPYKLK
jgi:E3 ubiquitin-protein ligase RNF213